MHPLNRVLNSGSLNLHSHGLHNSLPGGDDEVKLTRREQEVLSLIVAGVRLGDIADRLFLSAKTVSTHKMNLMRKLGVDNNADLIRLAIRKGLDM